MDRTRIAIVDDHPTLLAGMAAIFAGKDEYEIVGTGTSADDALAIAGANSPEVMIVDLSMPGDVFGAIAEVTARVPPVHVVVFTAFANVDMALRAVDAGAEAFVLKGRPSDDLFSAIQAVKTGERFVSPDFSPRLGSGLRHRSPGA
jgi:two-component system nitrate/nitrite response regulator NarL